MRLLHVMEELRSRLHAGPECHHRPFDARLPKAFPDERVSPRSVHSDGHAYLVAREYAWELAVISPHGVLIGD